MTNILFIAGIPGTGKTSIGNYLKEQHNFTHINMEDPPKDWPGDLEQQATKLRECCEKVTPDKKLVITWGFLPDHANVLSVVKTILEYQPLFIWFDGNRPAARREFVKRGTVQENLFNLQITRIDNTQIIRQLSPTLFNTFNADGIFLDKSFTVEALINRMNDSKEIN